MFPECSVISLYFTIMFWCIWGIFLMFDAKFHEKFCESLPKLTSTISSYGFDLVGYFMEDVPNKLHTRSHTMLRVYMRSHKSTTIIKSIILHFRTCSSEWETDIYLYFLPWYLQRVSLESLSSHICCISCIAYFVSLEDPIHSRLIDDLSCNIFYSPCKLTSSHLWKLTS